MRDYGRIYVRGFWSGERGKQLRDCGHLAQVIAAYLKSAPMSTMIGLYYLPMPTMCHEVGCTEPELRKALKRLSDIGYAHYDEPSEYVWIPTMAAEEMAPTLKLNDKGLPDNRITWIKKELAAMPPNVPFIKDFLALYREAFNLHAETPPKAPSRPSSATRSDCSECGTPFLKDRRLFCKTCDVTLCPPCAHRHQQQGCAGLSL
jgi:hypothetical protein